MKNMIREITPLTNEEFFVVLYHPKAKFDFPTHYHPEYEINYVEKAKGTRVVGETVCTYDEMDMVITGPNIYHSWQSETGGAELVVTIQFQKDLLPASFNNKKLLTPIKEMLERSNRGIEFSKDTILRVAPKIKNLIHQEGFQSFLSFLSILHEMAVSENQKILCSPTFSPDIDMFKSRRIRMATAYINKNYQNKIMITDVAGIIGMTNSSFCHFFKKRTHKSFVDYLNEVRIGHASVQLIETTKTISEVCYNCGFNNVSNFNRIFRSKKGLTPSEFRKFNHQQIMKY
jgi:AraC-like DNA-binding protein/quercetin dioxygenase-like cupin family protein